MEVQRMSWSRRHILGKVEFKIYHIQYRFMHIHTHPTAFAACLQVVSWNEPSVP